MVKLLSLKLGQTVGMLGKLFRASLYVTEYAVITLWKVTCMPAA